MNRRILAFPKLEDRMQALMQTHVTDKDFNLARYLFKHPEYTFGVRVNGNIAGTRIKTNDLLIADCAATPTDGDVVIVRCDGELEVARFPIRKDKVSRNHLFGVVLHGIYTMQAGGLK